MIVSRRPLLGLAVLSTFVVALADTPRAQAQTGFADPAFQRTWERTDKPVADGKANRSWYWGPTPSFSLMEPYKDAPVTNVLNDKPADKITMPDGFSNVTTKCDHGNRIYVAFHGDGAYASIAVVPQDPSCR